MIYRGKVTRVSAGRVFVEVPRLAKGYEFGPLATVAMPAPPGPIAVGDAVLLAAVEGRPDDLIILGKL